MAGKVEVPQRLSDPAKHILHATDFSSESEVAFAHALGLALANKARLTLMHVGDRSDVEWSSFPSVRSLLQRWGLLEPGAARADVTKLGIGIEKTNVVSSDVVAGISSHLVKHPVDLLVLATAQRRGLAGWLQPSKAEKAAQRMAVPTLFVPDNARPCISMETGRGTMHQVLLPVDHQPRVGAAIERGLRAIAAFGDDQSKLTLLHVGPENQFPELHTPTGPWQIIRSTRQGNPVTEILAAANETEANLLIMVTKGTDGFLDMLRGTTTEQVLRQAPCPVLSIPANF